MNIKELEKNISLIEYRIKQLEKERIEAINFLTLKDESIVSIIDNASENYQTDEIDDIESYYKDRKELSDEAFKDRVREKISKLPSTNSSEYFEKFDLKIGIIADPFLYTAYSNTVNLYYITKDNYKELQDKVDFVIIVTAWKGLSDEWVGLGNPKNSTIRNELFQIIDSFKKVGKKVVFYSKEDPTNYVVFLDIAKKCDIIFTTAVEKVPDYKKDCNNPNVYLLEFGFNPLYNNPIALNSFDEEYVIFAGSWYKKYPSRQRDTQMLFDGVISSNKNLKILDRNYYRSSPNYLFPRKYLQYISPSIEHETLQRLSKINRWNINLNSVQFSQTMFASRVYELLAMGNLLLSNYSSGVNNLFPTVFNIFSKGEVSSILNVYTEIEKYHIQLHGVRMVFRNHTTFHRLNKLISIVGYEERELENRKVAVVFRELSDKMKENFNRQTYLNKTLISYEKLKEQYEQFDYITYFDDRYEYGEFYLEDMINGFKYTDVSFITKDSFYNGLEKVEGVEHNFISEFKEIYRTIFSTKRIPSFEKHNEIISKRKGLSGYSIDCMEINTKEISIFSVSNKPKFSVIVPIYNNGDHLFAKCFLSLRRSSMFNDMEIILVDDGSTDNYTPKIINRLVMMYPNVKAFYFRDGGSGSASRPRNKGVELASTEYITFLDPDNEAINDGYAKLYKFIRNNDKDVVIGNIIKASDRISTVNYFDSITTLFNKYEFDHKEAHELLIESSFKIQSIQAMMFNRKFLVENNINMVVGLVGEDTLFFYEALLKAESFALINELVHVYYAAVEGSAVNYITVNTFKKYKEIEKKKYNFFKENNLLPGYMALRFNYYFKNWYLKKLEMVREDEKELAGKILYDIYLQYADEIIDNNDEEIIKFRNKYQ